MFKQHLYPALALTIGLFLASAAPPADARYYSSRPRLLHQRLLRLRGYHRLAAFRTHRLRIGYHYRPPAPVPSPVAVSIPAAPLPPDMQAILDAPLGVLRDMLANTDVPLDQRQVAALLLGRYDSDESLLALAAGLSDPAPALQQACILALRWYPGDDVEALLREEMAEARDDVAQVAAVTLAQRGVQAGIRYLLDQARRPEDIWDPRTGLAVGVWRTVDDLLALQAIRAALRIEPIDERRRLLKQALTAVASNLRGRHGDQPEAPRSPNALFPPVPVQPDPPKDVMGPAELEPFKPAQ